ncbi:MAG: hypothetical protein KBB86_02655 [Candidatus Pacebacteria bacterium]|nr:hypothetical protein [Candidatus Paceibacterota bacterium]
MGTIKNSHNFSLETLLNQLDKEGNIKEYTYEESKKIFANINEGLPEFLKEEKVRDSNARNQNFKPLTF